MMISLLARAQQDSLVVGVPDSTGIEVDSSELYAKYGQQQRRPSGLTGSGLSQNNGPSARGRAQTNGAASGLPGESVEYGSKDSSYTDLVRSEVHLFGEAYLSYKEFRVTAGYIFLDLITGEVEARDHNDGGAKPLFVSGDQQVSADRIQYNINTEQGLVHGARIQQDNLFIHGAVSKFKRAGSDALHIDDVIYNKNALITTCEHDHPHWGIRTTKFKMIPQKLAVIGPMDMELGGIPTPLAFPFAFAPLFSFGQSSSGIIFPQDPINSTAQLGLGMRGLGYHFAISERMNLTVTGDIYTRGSWTVRTNTKYRKRYKYNGNVDLSYSHQLLETANSLQPNIQNSYAINISHRQDGKAHPFRTVGGTLRFSVNDFQRRNFSDAQSQLNSQINSNFNYAYRITPKLNFSTGISHSQNTQTRSITFTLPTMQMRLQKVFPFKKKGSSGSQEKWFEKINFQYNGQLRNTVTTQDSILFTQETLDRFRAGVSHEMGVQASYKLLQYFSFNTNINYDEFWYFQTQERFYNEGLDTVETRIATGFEPLRDLNLSAGISTNVFGTLQFKKGWLRGLRHRMTPNISLSYRPGTDRFEKFVDADPDDPLNDLESYNPFVAPSGERLWQSNSLSRGGMSMNYSIDNTFEGKYWSKKDSTEKKFKLFDRVGISGNYNFQADSLNWSDIRLSSSASFLNRKVRLSISGSLTPYVLDGSTKRNEFLINNGGGLLQFNSFNLTVNTAFTLQEIRDVFRGIATDSETDQRDLSTEGEADPEAARREASLQRAQRNRSLSRGESTGPPELFSWFEDFSISHNIRLGTNRLTREFEVTANSIQIRTGRIPLSEKWNLQVDNISYDFKRGNFVYPSFRIFRQLHCWEMSAGWQPQLDTFSFFIGVSASPFGDYIKYQTGRDQFSSFGRFN
ncbi:MAG: putative LPS assembly protein LptD [Bacteroidota bacterium]